MSQTGWTGEPADAAPMPLTELLTRQHERGPGDALEMAAARSRAADARQALDEAAGARDPDEVAAAMVSRGYAPGLVTELSQRLADTEAQLSGENDKIAAGRRRQEWIARDHQAGSITAFDIARMQDFDEGDPGIVQRLERRRDSLRSQITEAQAAIAPPQQRQADPLAAATSRANQAFRETTRAKLAAAEQGLPVTSAPRPFAGPGGDADPLAFRSHLDSCPDCRKAGVTAEGSATIHAGVERMLARDRERDAMATRASGYDPEVERLTGLGYSLATAQQAVTPWAEAVR